MTDPITTIVVDDTTYQVESFSTLVQDLISLRNAWQEQLDDERLATIKTESAIKQVDFEIAKLVTKELEEL